MASENRPGVIVVQELRETPAAVATPTLNPVVVGPCYQIVNAIDSSGAVNGDAEYTTQRYTQTSLAITQAEFPDPRDNIDEINIDESQVGARLLYAGALTTLPRGSHGSTGSAFLASLNEARRAVVVFDSGSTEFAFGSTTLLLNIKANSPSDATPTVVPFVGTMSPAAVAAALAGVPGVTVTAYSDLSDFDASLSTDTGVVIQSRVFGAASSIFVTGSALPTLTDGESSALVAASTYRIEGSGFRGQDDLDGDLTTPWIEFHTGQYLVNAAVTSVASPFFLQAKDGTLGGVAPAPVFTGSGATVPLKAATATTPGDEFWADGTQVGAAVVTAVESARFKLGTLDSSRSTFDADGNLSSAVYSTVEVSTPSAMVPFAPVYAYFIANNLVWGSVTPAPEAAELLGDDGGALAALPAQLLSSPFSATIPVLTGGTLTFRIVEDGVTLDDVTHTFTASVGSNLAAAVTSLNANTALSALTFSLGEDSGGDKILMVSTVKTGADQSVMVLGTESTTVVTTFGFASGDTAVGVDVEYAEVASVTSTALDFAGTASVTVTVTAALGDLTLSWDLPTLSGSGIGSADEFAAALAGETASGGTYPLYFENDTGLQHVANVVAVGSQVRFTLVRGGAENDITVAVANTARMAFGSSATSGTDAGADTLKNTRLKFTLDSNPHVYEVDFTSNSLREAVDAINEAVGGSTDIASEDGLALLLTSAFSGAASKIEVVDDADDPTSTATPVLFSTLTASGSGRPNPSFYVDGEGTVHISPHVLRNRSTGVPLDLTSSGARVYIDYVGLRLDVTSAATNPALLTFTDVETMDAAIGPISTENPLALACFLMLQNAPTQSVSALGVSAVNDAAPMGTTTAHLAALTFLESKDVYAIAPLTDDPFVQQLYSTHVESMSAPEERGERIAIMWQGLPTRAQDTSILSGSDARVNGASNSITLGSTPIEGLAALGLDPADLEIDDNVYLELVVSLLGETSVYRFSVSAVNGTALTLRSSFTSSENTDGFFDTPSLDWTDDENLSDMTFALRQRGSKLLVTGTSLTDYAAVAATAAAQGESYNSRRTFLTFSGNVDTSIDGIVTSVPGYYACAAIAAMIGELPPQQPFTLVSMTGFSRVYGTDDTFSENQLDTVADGGRYILINQGGRIASRHQRSTKSTSIEARELSITKAIDFLAKGLRATNRVYIGRFVINPGFIDQLVMSNEGYLARAVQAGVVNSAALNGVLQDSSAPDTVLIEVTVAPAYPCNKIRITIVS
jgi:hypothetical protein